MTRSKPVIALVAAIGVIAAAAIVSLVARPTQPIGPTPAPTFALVVTTPQPSIAPTPTPMPTIPPTPIPTVPAAFGPVPAELLITAGGPKFPLPGGAQVTSDRPLADGSWRLTAMVADRATADAFYAALNDTDWPRSAGSGPLGTVGFDDASGRFTTATVRVYEFEIDTAEIIVTFAAGTPKELPNVLWLADAIPNPDGHLPAASPLPGFPVAWRPAGLTVVGETESNAFFYGIYSGSADSFATIVAAYEALATASGGTELNTEYSDDRTEALITSSLGFVAVIIENEALQVAVEVAR